MAPTDIGTEPHLRGKWQQVVVKFSTREGLCSTTPMLSHSISTTRPLVMHLRAASLALKCMARASFRCIGSLYVYRPLLSDCHDEGASNEGSISGKSGSMAQWPSRSDCLFIAVV